MIRIFHPYWKWEDHRAGMYQTTPGDVRTPAALSEDLLADPVRLLDAMRATVRDWPVAAEHNLTNLEQNRRAWLGQAACCHAHGARQDATKMAWWRLAPDRQEAANAAAEQVITEWARARSSTPSLFDTWTDDEEVRGA